MPYPEWRHPYEPVWCVRPDVPLDAAPLPARPATRARALAIRETFCVDCEGFSPLSRVLAACAQRGLLADWTPATALEMVRRTIRPITFEPR